MTSQPKLGDTTQSKASILLGLPSIPTVICGMIASAAVFVVWRVVDPAMTLSRDGRIVWSGALLLLAFSVSAFFGLQGYGKWLFEHRQRTDSSEAIWLSAMERLIVVTSWGQLALVCLTILVLAA